MKNKEGEERQRKIEAKEQLLAVMKADQIFWEHEKEKKRKTDKERREVQDAHIHQMVMIHTQCLYLLQQQIHNIEFMLVSFPKQLPLSGKIS